MSKKFVCLTALCLFFVASAGGAETPNKALFEFWLDIGSGTSVAANLRTNAAFPAKPTQTELRDSLKGPVDWKDNYGERARAYLTPPESGVYTFWISGDDNCELWLSSNDKASNARLIAQVASWTNNEEWGKEAGQKTVVALTKGQRYYIEALMKEGGGGDSMTVAWGGPGVGAGPIVIAGTYLTAPDPATAGTDAALGANFATAPQPASGATEINSPLFQWTAGKTAILHEVYMGTNPNPGAAEFMGPWPVNMYFHVPGLTPGATYYWRVDEVDATGNKSPGLVWSFTVQPLEAHVPTPFDGMQWRPLTVTLKWLGGQGAVKHQVYLSDDKAAVTSSAAGALKGEPTTLSLDVSGLKANATYYWRVNEVDGANKVVAGPVWSFSTIDAAGGMVAQYWNNRTLTGPAVVTTTVPSVNYSWPDGTVKGTNSPDAAINTNDFSARYTAELLVPVSGKWTLIESSDDGGLLFLDGVQVAGAWATGGEAENASAALDLVAGQRYVLALEYFEATGGAAARLRWSGPGYAKEIIPPGALQLPKSAVSPGPVNKATDLGDLPTLSWLAGVGAASHKVFLGTDEAKVKAGDPNVLQGTVTKTEFVPAKPLNWNTTYYWRVDEVAAAGAVVPGLVWNFKVADFIPVDLVGQTLNYNNTAKPFVSELVWDTAKDWTKNGVTDLVLQSLGRPVDLIDQGKGAFIVGAGGHDIWDAADDFRFIFKKLSGDGSATVKVDSLANTNGWAKAGVMIRENLTDGSKMAYMIQSRSNGVSLGWRATTGAGASNTNAPNVTGIVAPQWVKLTRKGDAFTAQYSADGTTWLDVKNPALTGTVVSQTVTMAADVYIGLCVTSHDNTRTTVAELSGAALTGTVTGEWQQAWIGDDPDLTNSAAGMYVAVEDTAGKVAAVSLGDPAATNLAQGAVGTAQTWKWKVPLSAFVGANLKNVAKLHVGVGDMLNPKAGGIGRVVFSNIRVQKPPINQTITAVVRAKGQSGDRAPIGAYDGATAPLATPAGGLKNGDTVFSDRTFTWVKTPVELAGAEYVRTFNSDKAPGEKDVTYTVTTARAATIAITVDDRITDKQAAADTVTAAIAKAGTFVDTGLDLFIQENATTTRTMSVFAATLAAGTYVFDSMDTDLDFYTIGAIPVPVDVTSSWANVLGLPSYEGWPVTEFPGNVVDNSNSTKYLNYARGGGPNGKTQMPAGFQVAPFDGASIVTGLTFTSANDAAERDPVAFELSGSNGSLTGPWTLIAKGDIADFKAATAWARLTKTKTAITFNNNVSYKYYQVMFTAIRTPTTANSMQIAEVELLGAIVK